MFLGAVARQADNAGAYWLAVSFLHLVATLGRGKDGCIMAKVLGESDRYVSQEALQFSLRLPPPSDFGMTNSVESTTQTLHMVAGWQPACGGTVGRPPVDETADYRSPLHTHRGLSYF
jgi:hypothetical protein